MAIKTIADIDVAGRRVLMRADFNCPLADGKVANDRRIAMALPTINRILDGGAKLILMSHLGRPAGKGFERELSLRPVAERLGELLDRPVRLGPPEVVSAATTEEAKTLTPREVLLLENLRFSPGETMPDKAKKNPDGKLTPAQQSELDDLVAGLAALGDVYVNDAFGACHRKHASMYGVARAIQSAGGPAVAGLLVEKEIKYLCDAVANPGRPFVVVLGGVKVSDKIKLISSVLDKVDRMLIGGAMAYTLLKARGFAVGNSRVEDDQVEPMKKLLAEAGQKILLPCDHVAADDFSSDQARAVEQVNIPAALMGMDIGPKTAEAFGQVIAQAKTIVWNGPMGVFEREPYATGTKAVATAVAEATDNGAVSVIGGGDSAAAVEQMGLGERMTHVSTGGGASLTYLEGKPMPPLQVLDRK